MMHSTKYTPHAQCTKRTKSIQACRQYAEMCSNITFYHPSLNKIKSIYYTSVDKNTFWNMTANPMLKNLLFGSAAANEATLMDLKENHVLPAIQVIKPAIPWGKIHDGASVILANPFIHLIPYFHQSDCG